MDQLTTARPDVGEDEARMTLAGGFARASLCGSVSLPPPEDPSKLVVSLLAGPSLLGTIRLQRMDAAPGDQAVELTFAVPDFGIAAFARLSGLDISITAETPSGQFATAQIFGADRSPASWAPLESRKGIGEGASVRLVDIWFESSRTVALRFESARTVTKSIDAYQKLPGAPLVLVGSGAITGRAAIAEMRLLNPFAPLLLVFKGEDGSIDAIDFVPFPSLMRGGSHHAELLISRAGAGELADAARLSQELVAGWMQRLAGVPNCIGTVEIDPAVHTGLEPILNEQLLSWMSGILGVRVNTGTDRLPQFIVDILSRQETAGATGAHILHVPADSIPTIAALLNVLPANAKPEKLSGGIGVCDWNRHGRVWSIWQPPFSASLEKLQPGSAPRAVPCLTIKATGKAAGADKEAMLGFPLALAFREPPTRIGSSPPFEIAPEVDPPLLHSESLDKSPVDALVLFDTADETGLALLESLARQVEVPVGNVIFCRPAGLPEDQALVDALADLFQDRWAIVEVSPTAGRLEQLAMARDRVTSERALVVEAATILVDSRTLVTLTQLLSSPDVASAGCLLRAANDKMAAASAGYSFTGMDLRTAPSLAFDVIDPAVWRAPTTYPVVASSLSVLLTRREFLATMSTGGSSASRPENDDLLFGIQLIENGGVNLCTTTVSAYNAGAAPRSGLAPLSVPYGLSPEAVRSLAEAATVVQRVA
jgi:hypothetical protein